MVIQRLSNTQLCIKQFCFQNVLKNSVEFVDYLKKFYIKQATGNIGAVVSSLVFGNIFSTMTRAQQLAIKDFIDNRNKCLGAMHVYSSLNGSMIGFISEILIAVTQVCAICSFDSDFTRDRRIMLSQSHKSADQAFENSFKALGVGVWRGISGIIVDPIKHGRIDGFKGVCRGIGIGVVGVAVKPVCGVIDFGSQLGLSIANVLIGQKPAERLDRQRVYSDGRIVTVEMDAELHKGECEEEKKGSRTRR